MREDAAKKKELWNKITEAWFPGGPTDPDVALVQVRIVHANYWDVKSSKLVQLLAMAKAAVTGKPPADLGELRRSAHALARGIRSRRAPGAADLARRAGRCSAHRRCTRRLSFRH